MTEIMSAINIIKNAFEKISLIYILLLRKFSTMYIVNYNSAIKAHKYEYVTLLFTKVNNTTMPSKK